MKSITHQLKPNITAASIKLVIYFNPLICILELQTYQLQEVIQTILLNSTMTFSLTKIPVQLLNCQSSEIGGIYLYVALNLQFFAYL
jgi:hypothetical protein